MRSLLFRAPRWSAERQRQQPRVDAHRPPACEILENRRLLSVTAAEAADGISPQELNVVGTYTG